MKHHYHTKSILLLLLLFLFSNWNSPSQQPANLEQIMYQPTDANFANPERGFYNYSESIPGGSQLNASSLRNIRSEGKSMIIRLYYIADFRESDLSQAFLDQIEAEFEVMRQAGIKAVIRFRYTKSMDGEDATLERVLGHLDQLQPVFERNYDVIAFAHAGFIGPWGEWHNSSNNLTTISNMRNILFKFLDVLPVERAIQIRYPQAKMQIFETHTPLGPDEAFSGSHASRSGHHNDCFLASPTDVGTYRIGPTWEKNFLHDDTRYLPMGGETCNPRPDAGDRYHCETALAELAQMRWSYLNDNYSRQILDTWVDQGCMPEVQRRLGYRFVMTEGSYSEEVRAGGSLHFDLEIINEGFAAPYNPRGLQVILRDVLDHDNTWEVNLPDDPRFWLGGDTIRLSYELGIPDHLGDGFYDLMLNLPDPADRLRHNPDYSIRIANQGIWYAESGFNNLQHQVVVDEGAGGDDYDGDMIFQEFGTWTSAGDDFSGDINPDRPTGITLHHNYPNPFNPSTQLDFELPEAAHVRLEVFNVMGQHVTTLVDEYRSGGIHQVTFDAGGLASGTYLYQLTSGDTRLTRSMLLFK